jgi:hypothetical protein
MLSRLYSIMYRLYILRRPTSFRASGIFIDSTTFRPRKEDAWSYILLSLRFLHQLTSLFPLQSFSHSVHRNSSIYNLATNLSSKVNRARRDHKNEQIGKSLERRQNHHLCGSFPWTQYGTPKADTFHGSMCWQLHKVRSSAGCWCNDILQHRNLCS